MHPLWCKHSPLSPPHPPSSPRKEFTRSSNLSAEAKEGMRNCWQGREPVKLPWSVVVETRPNEMPSIHCRSKCRWKSTTTNTPSTFSSSLPLVNPLASFCSLFKEFPPPPIEFLCNSVPFFFPERVEGDRGFWRFSFGQERRVWIELLN